MKTFFEVCRSVLVAIKSARQFMELNDDEIKNVLAGFGLCLREGKVASDIKDLLDHTPRLTPPENVIGEQTFGLTRIVRFLTDDEIVKASASVPAKVGSDP